MTTPSGKINVSDVNIEIGIRSSNCSNLGFLNGYMKPSLRKSTVSLSQFQDKAYFKNTTEGNCANGNVNNCNCNCGGLCSSINACAPVNCLATANCTNINCTNCDPQKYLQSNCNCACTYNCINNKNCYSYNCNCACSKIICTKLHSLGMLSDDIFEADQAYGDWLMVNDPIVYNGYIRWAKTVTECMDGTGPTFFFWIKDKDKRKEEETKFVIKWAKIVATPWAEHMAHLMDTSKIDNPVGKVIMTFGRLFCKLAYRIPESESKIGFFGTWSIFIVCISSFYIAKALAKIVNLLGK